MKGLLRKVEVVIIPRKVVARREERNPVGAQLQEVNPFEIYLLCFLLRTLN